MPKKLYEGGPAWSADAGELAARKSGVPKGSKSYAERGMKDPSSVSISDVKSRKTKKMPPTNEDKIVGM